MNAITCEIENEIRDYLICYSFKFIQYYYFNTTFSSYDDEIQFDCLTKYDMLFREKYRFSIEVCLEKAYVSTVVLSTNSERCILDTIAIFCKFFNNFL